MYKFLISLCCLLALISGCEKSETEVLQKQVEKEKLSLELKNLERDKINVTKSINNADPIYGMRARFPSTELSIEGFSTLSVMAYDDTLKMEIIKGSPAAQKELLRLIQEIELLQNQKTHSGLLYYNPDVKSLKRMFELATLP